MAPQSSPLALRPWPVSDKKPKTLGEFIARANAAPGGFRELNAQVLRSKIEARKAGAEPTAEMDVDEGSESDDADEDLSTVTPDVLRKARDEVLKNIEAAHQSAMLTQDLVSLLMSKENPTAAKTTISPGLAALKLTGTMGADKLAAPQTNAVRLLDGKIIATGWKLIEIGKSMDSILVAATRLQKEISLETIYWAEVLGVSEKGWSVCRLPHEKETLGVRFGFSESAPQFQNNNLAPMRRKADGSVDLAAPKVAEPQRVRVSIERDGMTIGRSALSKATPTDAPLEARVLEARNTIFHQELWHEINKEARSLLSFNVRLEGPTVSVEIDKHTRAVFSLVAALDENEPLSDMSMHGFESEQTDVLAETVSGALSLLLMHAHRMNLRARSQPGPPHLRQARMGQPYALIRPVIAYLEYEISVDRASRFISDLTIVLRSAGYGSASYTLSESSMAGAASMARHASKSEALLSSFTNPREFKLEVTVTPRARFLVTGTTMLAPSLLTSYTVKLLPPSLSDDASDDEPLPVNVLRSLYPPAEFYPTLHELVQWVLGAVPRVLTDEAEEFAFKVAKVNAMDSEERRDFVKSISGTSLLGTEPDHSEIEFDVCLAGAGGTSGGDGGAENSGEYYVPELHVNAKWPGPDGGPQQHSWTWTVDGKERRNLEETYHAILKGDFAV